MTTLRVIDIVDGTSVDGPGLRTTIYFAGCPHHCFNCHNPQTWDPAAGYDMTVDEIINHIIENDFDVTFSGGDPLMQINALVELAIKIKLIGKNIWCYTGYTFEEVTSSAEFKKILPYVDVIVDGHFINDLRDISLRFRGSSNQRLVDVAKTLSEDHIVLFSD